MENTSTILNRTMVINEESKANNHEDKFIKLVGKIVGLHIVTITALYYLGMKIVMN